MRNVVVVKAIRNLVKGILYEVAASQRLVVWKDNGVVLRIAFVTPFHRPLVRLLPLRCEPPNVVCEHVQVGTVVENPTGELLGAASAQHHSSAVKTAVVEETRNVRIGSLFWVQRDVSQD
jgi:hypothetical protein